MAMLKKALLIKIFDGDESGDCLLTSFMKGCENSLIETIPFLYMVTEIAGYYKDSAVSRELFNVYAQNSDWLQSLRLYDENVGSWGFGGYSTSREWNPDELRKKFNRLKLILYRMMNNSGLGKWIRK